MDYGVLPGPPLAEVARTTVARARTATVTLRRGYSFTDGIGPQAGTLLGGLFSTIHLTGAGLPLISGGQMTWDGCVVELLVDVDEDGVVFDLARVHRDGTAGKHPHGLAGGQVVAGRVGSADQRVIVLEGALVQGLLLVGAGVVDRPDVLIIEADEADRLAQLLHEQGVADL
jgi:hypothetical protein